MDTEVVYVVGALFAGLAIGILIVLPFALRRRARDENVTYDIVAEEFEAPAPVAPPQQRRREVPVDPDDAFSVSRPTAPRPSPTAQLPEPPADGVPTEWAKRVTGPLEPGRVKGICSGCGTRISVSAQRPLRIACPVCGRTRLLA